MTHPQPSPIVDEVADIRTTREKYEGERSPEWFAIFDALRDYRMSNMVFEGTDDPFCLVDLMSNDGTSIATGEEEMAALADEISLALAALVSPPKAGAGEPDEVQQIIDASRRMAKRLGVEFVVNPAKVAEFVTGNTTQQPRVDGVRVTDEMVERVTAAVKRYTQATLFVDELREIVRSALASHAPALGETQPGLSATDETRAGALEQGETAP